VLQPVLPKSGLVVSEKGGLTELLCKPKILPLKSATLKKLEALQVSTAVFAMVSRCSGLLQLAVEDEHSSI